MCSLPNMDDIDCKPTSEELSKAIGMMAPWKAPVSDSILADFLRNYKSCLLHYLHVILIKCWRQGIVQQCSRLRWLGHVLTMGGELISKSLLYGELVVSKRKQGRPKIRFNNVSKRDLKGLSIRIDERVVSEWPR